MTLEIAAFDDRLHREQVVRLWKLAFGYDAPHNNPELAIDRKLAVADGLFLVALYGDEVIGTAMAGYDGHRGWIYSMAVHPDHRHRGMGSRLLAAAEERLISRGCVKINLQVTAGNEGVLPFYEAHGYAVEDRISMGKKLPQNYGATRPDGPAEHA